MTGADITLAALVAAVAVFVGAAVVAMAVRRGERGAAAPALDARLSALTDAIARRDVEDRAVQEGLARAREELHSLRVRSEERQRAEEAAWDVVRRLETVLADGSSRGRAGENLLESALAALPAGMLVRDFPVNGRRVEFAMVLPDGRRLPVDSKWTAVRELQALLDEEDPAPRQALARRVEEEVARRAKEVGCYLEASLTTPFAVACVPDAAFDVCRKAHTEAFARGVVLVPYRSALPILLALYALAERYGDAGDAQAALAEVEQVMASIELTLEHKVAKATTMLENAAGELRTGLGRVRGALARGRRSERASSDPEPEAQGAGGSRVVDLPAR